MNHLLNAPWHYIIPIVPNAYVFQLRSYPMILTHITRRYIVFESKNPFMWRMYRALFSFYKWGIVPDKHDSYTHYNLDTCHAIGDSVPWLLFKRRWCGEGQWVSDRVRHIAKDDGTLSPVIRGPAGLVNTCPCSSSGLSLTFNVFLVSPLQFCYRGSSE